MHMSWCPRQVDQSPSSDLFKEKLGSTSPISSEIIRWPLRRWKPGTVFWSPWAFSGSTRTARSRGLSWGFYVSPMGNPRESVESILYIYMCDYTWFMLHLSGGNLSNSKFHVFCWVTLWLWLFNIAMEAMAHRNRWFSHWSLHLVQGFSMAMLNNQMVYRIIYVHSL